MFDFESFSPSNFGRYISQSEELTDGVLEIDEWIPSKFSAANDIPSLMSLPTDSFMKPTTDESQISLNVLPMNNMEQIESVPIPHHGPGPIQRPNKLITSTVQSTGLANNNNTMLSPASPDVLDQINKLMFENNPSNQGTSMVNSVNNPNSSSMMADLTSPVINWSPFCASEWQNKQEQSWLLPNMQSSPIPINGSSSNPFVMVPPMVDHQRQTLRSDAPLWNPVLNTVSPRLTATGNRVQPTRPWHETFPSSASPTNDSNKLGPNGWLKFWNASDSSPNDGNLMNRRTRVSTNAPWDFNELSGDSVVPISNRPQDSPSSQVWWSSSSSDENNNKNSSNYDSVLGRDQSRWDFAR